MERDTSVIDMTSRIKLGYIYRAMINACNNPKSVFYKQYGRKGYIVCKEWTRSPVPFFTGFGTKYKNGDKLCIRRGKCVFCEDNCRWFSPAELVKMKREGEEVFLEGCWVTLGEACDKMQQSPSVVRATYPTRRKESFRDENNRDFEPVCW